MNKFLKLLLILAITPIILATAGFVILPSSVFAYIRDGKEVFIGSYMVYTFALINAVLSFFGITYLRRVRKKFNDENYPTGVTVVAFVNLLISIMCNYFTFSVLKLMLKNSKMEIPFYVIRIVFTLIAILTTIYGIYLRRVNKESEFAIRNKWTMSNDIVFGFANKFSGIVFIAGGIFMWGILLASICGFAIVLEKLWLFFTKEKDYTNEYRRQLFKLLLTKSKDEIVKVTETKKDSVSTVITKIMKSIDLDLDKMEDVEREYIEEIIREAVLAQTGELEKGMWLLGAVVNTAPQLGLLGTVTGMIASFSALTSNNADSAKAVAAGISEALYTTAFGLIVAIPSLVFYNYFNRRIDAIILEMERASLHFLTRIKKHEIVCKTATLECVIKDKNIPICERN